MLRQALSTDRQLSRLSAALPTYGDGTWLKWPQADRAGHHCTQQGCTAHRFPVSEVALELARHPSSGYTPPTLHQPATCAGLGRVRAHEGGAWAVFPQLVQATHRNIACATQGMQSHQMPRQRRTSTAALWAAIIVSLDHRRLGG